MKAIVLFLIVASQCAAQDALRGAYGLDFGSSKKTVQEFAAQQDWEAIKTWRADLLVFSVSKGDGSSDLECWFEEGRLNSIRLKTREHVWPAFMLNKRDGLEYYWDNGHGILPFKNRTGDCHTMCEYQKLIASLQEQFGNPAESLRDFHGAMIRGDERDVHAVKAGKAIIRDEWRIPGAHQDSFSTISAEVTVEGDIGITFRERAAPTIAPEQKHR